MRYSKQRKQDTRARILLSARRLFQAKGFAATSIDAIMQACSLTRGGFYAHFRNKSELYREALGKLDMRDSRAEIESLLDACLRNGSRESPVGFLASDIGSDDRGVRAAYTVALKSLRDTIGRSANGSNGGDQAILASAAMIVGALAVSRTSDDPSLNDALLNACRRGAQTLLEHADVFASPAFFWTPPMRAADAC